MLRFSWPPSFVKSVNLLKPLKLLALNFSLEAVGWARSLEPLALLKVLHWRWSLEPLASLEVVDWPMSFELLVPLEVVAWPRSLYPLIWIIHVCESWSFYPLICIIHVRIQYLYIIRKIMEISIINLNHRCKHVPTFSIETLSERLFIFLKKWLGSNLQRWIKWY